MSKKANPKVVGSFVIGAIALSIIGIMILGGGSFMEDKFECVLFFDESISGLDVGAPVDFQGVRIGTVTEVWMEFDAQNGTAYRPVKMQIEGNRIRHTDGLRPNRDEPDKGMERLVEKRGLRARLASQSMLTGKLKIELGFFPDKPVVRVGRYPDIWEMPTIPSPIRQMTEEVSQLPLGEIVKETHRVIQRLADVLDQEETGKVFSNLNETLDRLESVLTRVDAKIDPLTQHSSEVLVSTRATLDELRGVLDTMDKNMGPLMSSLTESSDRIKELMDPQSAVGNELVVLIEDIKQTSASLRRFVDYIDQHPEAVLRGKK